MMKNTILSACIPLLMISASSVNAYEIYSTSDTKATMYAQIRWHISKDIENSEQEEYTITEPRLGFRLNSSLTDETALFAHSQLSLGKSGGARHDSTFENRLSFVGLKNDTFGKFTVGKQWILSDTVLYTTNKAYEYWSEALRYSAFGGAGRNSSLIKYEYNVGDLWLAANHGFVAKNNDEITEFAASYALGPVKLSLVGGKAEQAKNGIHGNTNDYAQDNSFYGGVLGYSNDELKLDLLYSAGEIESGSLTIDEDSYIVSASYKVSDKSKLFAGYEILDQSAAGHNGDYKGGYLGVDYRFNRAFLVFAEYTTKDGNKLDIKNRSISSWKRDSSNINLGLRVFL